MDTQADAETQLMDFPPNRLQRQLARLKEVPAFARHWYRNVVLHRAVPFTGTAGVSFAEVTPQRVVVELRSERRVHNHIGGIHASATNLLAETASGMVVGMNVRDDCIPLAKDMRMAFRRPATGALQAVARLTEEQRMAMRASDRGDIKVSVIVTDEAGVQPVECEFIWAWIPAAAARNQESQHG